MPGRRSFKTDESFYRPKLRPSGHDISRRFADNNGGAIPSNLLQIANTESHSPYQRHCATVGVKPHPARFPEKLPTFFVSSLAHRMGEGGRRPGEGGGRRLGRLTDPGDLPAPSGARQAGTVLDIFAGSNTTGSAATELICNVESAISNQAQRGAASALRFVDELPAEKLATLWSRLHSDDLPVEVNRQQRDLVLREKPEMRLRRGVRRVGSIKPE